MALKSDYAARMLGKRVVAVVHAKDEDDATPQALHFVLDDGTSVEVSSRSVQLAGFDAGGLQRVLTYEGRRVAEVVTPGRVDHPRHGDRAAAPALPGKGPRETPAPANFGIWALISLALLLSRIVALLKSYLH